MKYCIEMWKRAFDYKGKSGREEFWVPFGINAGLAVLMVALGFLKYMFMAHWIGFFSIAVCVYLIASFVPFIALTVRRLHDAGRSGKWYWLIFGFGVGAVILLIMCTYVIDGFDPFSNMGVAVYGPPPSEYNVPGAEEAE